MLKFISVLVLFLVLCEAAPLNDTEEFLWVVVDNAESDNVEELDYEVRTRNNTDFAVRSNFIEPRAYAIGVFRKVNWYTAQLSCASRGLSLASINNAREAETLRSFLVEKEMNKQGILFWTSGTDQAEHRDFHWFTNGRPFIYENWASNQPSYNGRCVAMDSNGQWTTMDCICNAYFICENHCSASF